MSGALALVGSGEYMPIMQGLETALLNNAVALGKKNRYIQIPTAAGQEDPDRLNFWRNLGARQAQRMNTEPIFLPIYKRDDAMNQAFADEISDAGLIYLSGGDPGYLAQTLINTPVWAAIETAWKNGSSLAGCSAGAMAMGNHVPNFFRPKDDGTQGFGTIGDIRTIPHYDKFFRWIPDSAARLLLTAPDGTSVIGIDENTALVTGLISDTEVSFAKKNWRVDGAGKAHLLRGHTDAAHQFAHGEILTP
jgi:cyanophycinase-like exopeptidase